MVEIEVQIGWHLSWDPSLCKCTSVPFSQRKCREGTLVHYGFLRMQGTRSV